MQEAVEQRIGNGRLIEVIIKGLDRELRGDQDRARAVTIFNDLEQIVALGRLLELAKADLSPHVVERELIALRCGVGDRPQIGMFLGGAGLADTMLYCRTKIYPLGLPNGVSHVLTAIALVLQLLLKLKASFLPPRPRPLEVSVRRDSRLEGRFTLLVVTTLEKMLLAADLHSEGSGRLKFLAVEERSVFSLLRAFIASLRGKLAGAKLQGVHFQEADEISIEGDDSSVILDGETFRAERGRPIVLQTTQPLSFIRLAA